MLARVRCHSGQGENEGETKIGFVRRLQSVAINIFEHRYKRIVKYGNVTLWCSYLCVKENSP
jgi:hypothetical protein